jgi:hypothetical protein
MTLPARFSLLHSDLNDFLFGAVGDEANGMPLNVVSALTRLGVDPWDEAARLSTLPKAAAVATLAPMIARLPICRPQLSDDWAISRRLVELLSMHGQAARSSPASGSREGQETSAHCVDRHLYDPRDIGVRRSLVIDPTAASLAGAARFARRRKDSPFVFGAARR